MARRGIYLATDRIQEFGHTHYLRNPLAHHVGSAQGSWLFILPSLGYVSGALAYPSGHTLAKPSFPSQTYEISSHKHNRVPLKYCLVERRTQVSIGIVKLLEFLQIYAS